MSHSRLWETLTQQGITKPYVDLLRNLYRDQVATVRTDRQSRAFNIERGVKQGDPLSSLLFNACLEQLFQPLKAKWTNRGFGIQLGHTTTTQLTNLRFADDVLLLAPTLPQLTEMLTDLQREAMNYGLELHPDKTKILTNVSRRRGRNARSTTDVNGKPVAILHYHDHAKYLGRKLTFDDYHGIELDNRIASAWRKFNLLRQELTSKTYPLKSRMRLFNATVTPTILYGSASWTLTKEHLVRLRRTQRRMLRLVIGTPRRTQQLRNDNTSEHSTDDVASNTSNKTDLEQLITLSEEELLEPWPDFIKRATRTVEATIAKLKIDEWTVCYLRRKWRWALRIANQDANRWSRIAAQWQPQLDDKRRGARPQARPRKRWDDDINTYLDTTARNGALVDNNNDDNDNSNTRHWLRLAENTAIWRTLEDHFIQATLERAGLSE